jgi:hypothetical protein
MRTRALAMQGAVQTEYDQEPVPTLGERELWRARAACVGDTVHQRACHETPRREDVAAAKAICATCPVTAECLQHARDFREWCGVWGGVQFLGGWETDGPRARWHGTVSGFTLHGCRCRSCTGSHRNAVRQALRRRASA